MKKILTSLTAFVMVLGLAAVAPASAIANPERANEMREKARSRAQSARENKEQRIDDIKAEVAARKLELQQDRCERREAKLQAALPRLSKNATTIKGSIDKVYDRVQGFYADGQLTVSNYQELTDEIELAKANAESSLEALATYELEVDCQDKRIGAQLDGFRTAVKGVREDLKAYRKSVVALVSALRAEAAEDKADDSSSEQEAENETEQPEQETENEQ